MLATLLIVFREVIEAGLIIGIVMAATKGIAHRGWWVIGGVAGGVLGACLIAAFAGSLSAAMEGYGQEWFNFSVLMLAVLMLTWHNVWMARHGRQIAMEMKSVGEDVSHGRRSLLALSIVIGVAVLREGAEIVLFLYGIAIAGNDIMGMVVGGITGLMLGGLLGITTYLGLLRIPSRHLFAVTGWMIALLAAGMAAQAVVFLEQAGIVEVLSQVLWDSSWLVTDSSIAGKTLHTLIGYTAQPTALQLVVYVVTLGTIFTLMRLFGHAPKPAAKTVAA